MADFKRVIDKSRRTSPPTKGLVRAHGDHDPKEYEAQFGTWSNAKAILNSLRDDEAYDDLPSESPKSDQDDDEAEMESDSGEPTETDSTEIPEELRKDKYTRADVLGEIHRIHEKVKARPSTADFNDLGAMSTAVAYNFFDSWGDAVAAAVEQSDSRISSTDKRSAGGSSGKETRPSNTSQTEGDESNTIDGEDVSTPDLSTLQGRNEGRIDELVLRVNEVELVRDGYYTAHLTVSSADLDEVTFEIWQKHDIDIEFESDQVYQFNQARMKVWGDPKDNDLELSSTRPMVVALPGGSLSLSEGNPGSSSGSESNGTDTDTEVNSTETGDEEEDIVDEIMGEIDI